MRTTFDSEKWNKSRKTAKWWGIGLLLFAIVDLIDMSRPFPIPFTGRWAIFTAIAASIPAVYFLYRGFGPPSTRVIMLIAEKYNGYVTLAVLLHELDMSLEMLEDKLRKMYTGGYIQPVNQCDQNTPVNQIAFKFVGVAARDTRPMTVRQQDAAAQPARDIDEINDALLGGRLGVDGLPQ